MDDTEWDDAEDYELTPRTEQEVAERVLGILATIGKVHFPEDNAKWIVQEKIQPLLTPEEAAFIQDPQPPEQARINFSWRAEALASLIWCLNGLDELPAFDEQFDVFENDMVSHATNHPQAFLAAAKLRPLEEREQMEEYLYHQHWRVRDHQYGFNMDQPTESDPPIETMDAGIVYERRYGMSWAIGAGDSWDDVPTDT